MRRPKESESVNEILVEQNGTFPPCLEAIFFAIFHETHGPQIIDQVPRNAIKSIKLSHHVEDSSHCCNSPIKAEEDCNGPENEESASPDKPLISFEDISHYIIPKKQFCNRTLLLYSNGYQVIGYPVALYGSKYPRNKFIFNCALVVNQDIDATCYLPIIRQIARAFQAFENLCSSISSPENGPQIVHHIIEQIFEDLNNYSECNIPLTDEININARLFPTFNAPPQIMPYHVPISLFKLERLMTPNWDLVVQKLVPLIDGVSSVQKIAAKADVDTDIAIQCMEHLHYYGSIVVADIFQFRNIYSCTPAILELAQDKTILEECVIYVCYDNPPPLHVTHASILTLYSHLRPGVRVKDWIKSFREYLRGIDILRFISFGVTKGYLYRIYRYPYLLQRTSAQDPLGLRPLLDGSNHLEKLCTDFKKSPAEMESLITQLGSVVYFQK